MIANYTQHAYKLVMTLRDLVTEALIKTGKTALAAKAGLSIETIRKVLDGHVPSPKTAYMLCKACDCSEEVAMALAKEISSSNSAKETA